MALLIALAILAQVLDLVTFAGAATRWGSSMEANPIMRAAYDAGGIGAVAGIKGATIGAAFLIAYAMQGAGAPPWLILAVFAALGIAGAIGAVTNVWALLL